MNAPLWPLTSWLLNIDLPGQPPDYARPVSSTSPGYIELLERNTHILYPALALLALGVLVAGVLQAWKSDSLAGLNKEEYKRNIIQELRRQVGGMSAESLARTLGLEVFRTVRLLEEMQKDGLLVSHTSTQRLTFWRLKGVGTSH